jgi:hypothetical protein
MYPNETNRSTAYPRISAGRSADLKSLGVGERCE